MRSNRLKEIWRSGKPAANFWMCLPGGLAAEIRRIRAGTAFSWTSSTARSAMSPWCAMLTAISTTDTVPLVRVAWNEPGDVMRALDAGAYGVMCPSVETAEECRRFVGACRYAPLGYRSVGPRRAMLYAGSDYVAHANDTLLSIIQIETAKGVANLEEIAAVEVWTCSTSARAIWGFRSAARSRRDQTDPVVVEAIDKVLACAKRSGLQAGIFCKSVEYARAMAEKGFDLVTVTSDEGLLMAGAAARANFPRDGKAGLRIFSLRNNFGRR